MTPRPQEIELGFNLNEEQAFHVMKRIHCTFPFFLLRLIEEMQKEHEIMSMPADQESD